MLEAFLISLAANFATHFSIQPLQKVFSAVAKAQPDLLERARNAETTGDIAEIDRIFQEAIGVIDAGAADGSIEIDGATLTALKGIRFDHEHGQVTIEGSTVFAPVLTTGGHAGSTGTTEIGGNTSLKSQGTEIKVGAGAAIKMTGGAQIKQT